ncbi:MAG TPA: aromatic amino acid ammonia-lyase [Gammaproteobacteria bacterium]|nr:aromatic amino acid ammonia-lyase [Gammaproteobacteria bacterium]
MSERRAVLVGGDALTLEDLGAIATGAPVALDAGPAFRGRIEAGVRAVAAALAGGQPIYGVTTGYGDSCDRAVPPELLAELPVQISRYHGCGLGRHFDAPTTRAILLARLVSLAHGYSGVRLEVLESLAALLNHDVLPLIPEEGSVGASGDLTPLSYVVAALIGEREVVNGGQLVGAAEALATAGLAPLTLAPKEGLALMNGTAVMTALAALGWLRAEYLARLAARITALAALALRSNAEHFRAELFAAKPHPGQAAIAARIHEDLAANGEQDRPARIQARYSIRCAPHVIGVLADALPWMRAWLETELNSANDNPLVDPASGEIYHGGHFYGGHVAFVADALKAAVANVADLLDRQLALLVDLHYNHGLPRNLSGATGERAVLQHGLKAVQIAVSAWTAEALKLTMPASVFSRSTECHNQDKVSMGTIAARDALRVLELTEQVAAACLFATCQATALAERDNGFALRAPALSATREEVFRIAPFLDEDRPLERELRALVDALRARHWPLGELLA